MYAFEKYTDDSKIISIGGYNKTEEMEDDQIYTTFTEPFFSAWGWIGANAIKDHIWPETPPAVVQQQEKKDDSKRDTIPSQR